MPLGLCNCEWYLNCSHKGLFFSPGSSPVSVILQNIRIAFFFLQYAGTLKISIKN